MSARRIQAKYSGRCHGCGGEIAVGETIAWLPPKGRRKRGQTIHDECAKAAQRVPDAPRGDWPARAHTRLWMSDEDFVAAEDAMRRMKQTPSPQLVLDGEAAESPPIFAKALEAHRAYRRQSRARRRQWPDDDVDVGSDGDAA